MLAAPAFTAMLLKALFVFAKVTAFVPASTLVAPVTVKAVLANWLMAPCVFRAMVPPTVNAPT